MARQFSEGFFSYAGTNHRSSWSWLLVILKVLSRGTCINIEKKDATCENLNLFIGIEFLSKLKLILAILITFAETRNTWKSALLCKIYWNEVHKPCHSVAWPFNEQSLNVNINVTISQRVGAYISFKTVLSAFMTAMNTFSNWRGECLKRKYATLKLISIFFNTNKL